MNQKPLSKFQPNILRIHFDGLTNLLLGNWRRKGCASYNEDTSALYAITTSVLIRYLICYS